MPGVSQLTISKTFCYEQTARGAPTQATSIAFRTELRTRREDDASGVTLSTPTGEKLSLVDQGGNFHREEVFPIADATQFARRFPAGNYTIQFGGGYLKGEMATVSVPGEHFPKEVPYLTYDSYQSLQGVDTSAAVTFSWNPRGSTETSKSEFTYFTLRGTDSPGPMISAVRHGSEHRVVIPSNILQPMRQYEYRLVFCNQHQQSVPSLAEARIMIAFEQSTTGFFSTGRKKPWSRIPLLSDANREWWAMGDVLRIPARDPKMTVTTPFRVIADNLDRPF